jgi:hypothetical protein
MNSIQLSIEGVHVDRRTWLENGLVAITGFLCGAVPEAGLVVASICGAWGVWRYRERWSARDVLILSFTLTRLVYTVRTQGPIWVALLEALVMLLLPRAFWILSPVFGRLFGFLILLGLCVPIGIAIFSVLKPQVDMWSVDASLAKHEHLGQIHNFMPVDPGNAWVLNTLGIQGPGSVEYAVEVRTVHPTKLIIFLIHSGLQNGRSEANCRMGPNWSTCRVRAVLPTPAPLIFGLGGYGLWKKGSPVVQVQSSHFRYLSPRNPFLQFIFFNRQMGPSFNENAFGAWVVVMSLLALCALRDSRTIFPVAIIMFLAVYLSGSRGAMFSGVFGLVTYVLAQSRFLRVLLPMLVFGLIGVFWVQINADRSVAKLTPTITAISPGFRAFELDTIGKQSRLEIWKVAYRQSLLEPISGPIWLTDAATGTLHTRKSNAIPHAHNLWIEMLVAGGLIQLAIAVCLFSLLLYRLIYHSNFPWLAVFMAILLINLGDFIFFYAPIRLCFGLILGLTRFNYTITKTSV